MTERHWLNLEEAAASIARREVTATDLALSMLARIDALDPRLHAYFHVAPEHALETAAERDRETAAGRSRGPLHGVPVAVKDLLDTTWAPTTAGTTIRRGHMAAANATVVERLEQAGGVILGKLALTEGALALHHPSVTPPVNPWNADRWTGVSSSGSGVATAAAMCFGSIGSDTGGSIRFPAAANGVVGVKPTWGRVSRAGVFPLAPSLDHVGPMARSVRDAALMLGVIAGFDPRDPTSLRAAVPDYRAACGRGVQGLRVGVDEGFVTRDMAPEVTGLVLESARVLETLGARVVPVEVPDVAPAIQHWSPICGAEVAAVHRGLYPERASEYGPGLTAFIELGRGLGAADYAASHEARLEFNGRLAAVFDAVDLLLCPSYGVPTPPATVLPDPGTMSVVMRFTAPFDFSGHPTISIPCGFAPDGMPASLQLVARHLEEESLFAAGAAYEDATEWHLRRPPLAT